MFKRFFIPHIALGAAFGAALLTTPGTATAEPCREFQKEIIVGGQPERAYGTACLQQDGSWKVVQEDDRITRERFGRDAVRAGNGGRSRTVIIEDEPDVIYRPSRSRVIVGPAAPALFNIRLGNFGHSWGRHHHRYNKHYGRHFDGHFRSHRGRNFHHKNYGRRHAKNYHARSYYGSHAAVAPYRKSERRAYRQGRRDGARAANRRHNRDDFGQRRGRGNDHRNNR